MHKSRTILMVALDQIANFKGRILPINMSDVHQVYREFNQNGLMLLLATAEGMKFLDDTDHAESDKHHHGLDINYPLSLIQMREEDLSHFCAIYLVSIEPITEFNIHDIPQLENIYTHCWRKNKIIALQCGTQSRIIYPSFDPKDIEHISKVPDDEANILFAQYISNLCKVQIEKWEKVSGWD